MKCLAFILAQKDGMSVTVEQNARGHKYSKHTTYNTVLVSYFITNLKTFFIHICVPAEHYPEITKWSGFTPDRPGNFYNFTDQYVSAGFKQLIKPIKIISRTLK